MKRLVLIPTRPERAVLAPLLQIPFAQVELCGFGPIAAAARTAQLLALHGSEEVLLLGIAGALSPELPMGTACSFGQVFCDGVGVGWGDQHQSAGEMGWPHWPALGQHAKDPDKAVGDHIVLGDPGSPALLTVCAATADEKHAMERRLRYPAALAEDMEGFAVALACKIAQIPLQIIRGISNLAGNRDHATWQMETALAATAEVANRIFASPPAARQKSAKE